MKNFVFAAAVSALCATSAFAEIASGDVSFKDGAVAVSLTGVPGDAASGRDTFKNRKLGNCLACHANDDMPEQQFHGEIAPPLSGVGDRWDEAELRGIVTNAKMMFEGTIMPAFYQDAGFVRTLSTFEGKSILTAQQVEDVVAYLLTLKE